MLAERAFPRLAAWIAGVLAVGLSLTGCGATGSPSSGATNGRFFTVAVTGAISTLDPTSAVGRTDSILVSSVFQRLMRVIPITGELKPDAANDCVFVSPLVYQCTLPNTLKFTNGSALTSTDVKFSIQRALRLADSRTSVGLLSALSRIETPNDQTIRFVLAHTDNQFGYALAAQAASIVDHRTFDPDAALPLTRLPIGSGPFALTQVTTSSAQLSRYSDYFGPLGASLDNLHVKVFSDSSAVEAAVAAHTVDAVWASLDAPGQQRIDDQIDNSTDHTANGFVRISLPGVKVTRLYWNPTSRWRANKRVRDAVALALQSDRTLDSIIPQGVPDHIKAFSVGGRAKLPSLGATRVHLDLGYDVTDPTQADQARLLRDRLEDLDSVSVRVISSGPADLVLTAQPPWVDNAIGWLQLYSSAPLPGSAVKVRQLEALARSNQGTTRAIDLGELQKQAAADNTVLPVSQTQQLLLVGPRVYLRPESYGSGQQLGLWGFGVA